jgi:hypothetical protein
MMFLPPIYSISSENKLPTIFSIGFVAVEFLDMPEGLDLYHL